MSTSTSRDRDVVIADVETNGRDPRRHRAWEVAAWNVTSGHRCEFMVHIPDLSKYLAAAEPVALRVGRFLDRYPLDGGAPTKPDTRLALTGLGDVLDGGRKFAWAAERAAEPLPVILGSNPGFDIGFLRALYLDHGRDDPDSGTGRRWHYHPIDLGSYAAGVLGIELGTVSLSAAAVADMCGLPPGGHSAGGDVTSEGRAYLLLRQAARVARTGKQTAAEWLAEYRENPCATTIEREFGTVLDGVDTTAW